MYCHNEVTLLGNLGADPELLYTRKSIPVAAFSLALNEEWTDADGKKISKVTWIDCKVWSGLAELCAQSLKKGSRIMLKGKLTVEEYQDKAGTDRKSVKVVGSEVIFLDPKSRTA